MGTRPLKNLCEVAVIGGGLAGLAAARHAARLGRLVTLFEGSGLWGGQLATVDHVDGLPIPGDYSGQTLAIAMLEEAQKVGIRVVEASIDKLEVGDRLVLTDWEGTQHYPESVILASGASLRKLGVPGEEEFAGRGVSRCASCDGGFYRGTDVAVIGGGDAAVHEALVLAKTSARVHVVCRSPLKAKREYIDRLDSRDNVTFHWDSEVTAILGEGKVCGVALRDTRTGAASELACAGVFPFIGVEPNASFLPTAMRDARGYAAPDDPRIFAVGAVRANYGGQAAQAMAEGIGAAEAAHAML
jgi:thioredoxin reductase (NADPH)